MTSESKIAVYSLADLKNTTDDALPNYLNSLKFKQSHLLTDVRLGLGYTAVAIAAATFYADWKLGWATTKTPTLYAVIVYFILNSALTIWIWGIEKGKIYVGSKDNIDITIASSTTKHIPVYKLKVRYAPPPGPRRVDYKEFNIEAPFTKWFTKDGVFVAKPFQEWLASEVPLIGKTVAEKTQ